MKAKSVFLAVLAIVSTSLFSACSSSTTSSEPTDTRIVSLTAGLTEIVYSLGLGDQVVGRDLSSTLASASNVEIVTNGHDVNAEAILKVRPTIVLADDGTRPVSALDQLRAAGIRVEIIPTPKKIEEISQRISTIGELLGVQSRASAVTEELTNKISAKDPALSSVRVAFLYLRGGAGVYLMGANGSGADVVISSTGARDAGSELSSDETFITLTPEALVKAKPDIFLMTTTGLKSVGGEEGLIQLAGIQQTPAGQNRRFVTVEDGLLFSLGPRTPQLIEQLRERFKTLMGESA